MTEDEKHPVRSWPSLLARLIAILMAVVAGVVLIALLALGVIVWQVRSRHFAAQDAVRQQIAEFHSAGEPITSQDMYAFHRLPPGTPDATDAWLAVLDTFDQEQFDADVSSFELETLFKGDMPASLSDDQQPAAQKLLAKYETTLAAAEKAAATPGECRFPVEFEKAYAASNDHIAALRSLGRLQLLSARLRALNGDIEGAIDLLAQAIATSAALSRQPSDLENIIRTVILVKTFDELQWLLNATELEDVQLARLQTELDSIDLDHGLTIGLLGDRALMFEAFRTGYEPGAVSIMDGHKDAELPPAAIPCHLYLTWISKFVAASREPFPQALRSADRIESEFLAAMNDGDFLERQHYKSISQDVTLDAMGFQSQARTVAYHQLLRVAVAAERYRLKTEAYPQALSDLVPEYLPSEPIDPFDGLPVRLTSSEHELLTYSVSYNFADELGLNDVSAVQPDMPVRIRAEKGQLP
ncbi:MAG: hypothetical protein WD872_13910 [Pirellulaceae bacterium]